MKSWELMEPYTRKITSKPQLTLSVSSIDDSLKKIAEAGGKVVMPKGEVPGGGYIAYATDTEGKSFGIFQGTLPTK